jgi:hypothetical protein
MLEERLSALESVLLAACWRALPEAERERIERASALRRPPARSATAPRPTRRAIRDRELRRSGCPLELG